MSLALVFGTPLLLIGLAAAAIPPVLHLLSRARAREVAFPTLRFLHLSMIKTARRRRVQHWLLMLLRCGVLALLAVAVAEPITRAGGAWLAPAGGSAAIVLDNSLSMSAPAGATSALAAAKQQACSLLEGPGRPELAAVLTPSAGLTSSDLTTRLDLLREGIEAVPASLARAALAQRVQAAAAMLRWQGMGQKSLYVFSDLQAAGFKELAALPAEADYRDVDLFIVNTAPRPADNIAVSDLHITGPAVAGAVMSFTAELVNSGPAERIVDVRFAVAGADGAAATRTARATLPAAGPQGSRATVRFQHRFDSPGLYTGTVTAESDDDLPADNTRHFCLSVTDRVAAAVVVGGTESGADVLMLALDPYADPSVAWPIAPRLIPSERLGPAELRATPVVFFCGLPAFSPAMAAALRQFVRSGGTAALFLGPDVQVDNYNQLLGSSAATDGPLLPGRIEAAIGQVGPQAPAVGVDVVDTEHPYLAGLYEQPADYRTVLVQRRFPLAVDPLPARVLMRLTDGSALLATRPYGRGAVVLCATSCSPQWSNLPLTGLFLPLVNRICLTEAAGGPAPSYPAGAAVSLQPIRPGEALALPAGAVVEVTPPPSDGSPRAVTVPLTGPADAPQAVFTATDRAGVYRWRVVPDPPGGGLAGAFAVNADGAESDLTPMDARPLADALLQAGWRNVLVAKSLAEVRSAAAARAAGHNWWDLLVALVIVLLVAEAVLANRFRLAAAATAGQSSVSTAAGGG